ncbi:hypothetical protein MFLAVUS_006465 [Mucor flavus]|uniref:Protein Zds1 C-terminal domain-containing protein n=1 Tax=Mucor flavus TaxID=439312 RepID=A0ABP9Z1M3_9FUNG
MQVDIESKNIFELRSQSTINYSKYKSESLQQDDITNQSSSPIWPADKHLLPNEFDLWIKTHANESGPNVPTKIQRKRSVLSMVSFLEESSSDDEEDEEEQAPLTPPRENFPTLPVLNQSEYHVNIPERKIRLRRQPPITRSIPIISTNSPIEIPEIETKSFPKPTKKPSWFKNLFSSNTTNTTNTNTKKPKTKKSEIFSGLFTSNNTYPSDHKKTLKKKKERVQRIPLITRYPLDMERAVYQLSHLKLNNIRRPLQQQVVISNMMYWYLSITEQIEYQQPPPAVQKEGDNQRPTLPLLTHVSTSTTQYQQQGEDNRPASPPPSPPLNDVSAKSSKKKYKPVPNAEYVSRQKY